MVLWLRLCSLRVNGLLEHVESIMSQMFLLKGTLRTQMETVVDIQYKITEDNSSDESDEKCLRSYWDLWLLIAGLRILVNLSRFETVQIYFETLDMTQICFEIIFLWYQTSHLWLLAHLEFIFAHFIFSLHSPFFLTGCAHICSFLSAVLLRPDSGHYAAGMCLRNRIYWRFHK